MEKRIAPIFRGADDPPENVVMDECPICMLFYPGGLNVARCCKKDICTECYLQIRLPGNAPKPPCPFCQRDGFDVTFTGPKSAALRAKEAEEERKVVEAQERMRMEEKERDIKREAERRAKREEEAAAAKAKIDAESDARAEGEQIGKGMDEVVVGIEDLHLDVDEKPLDSPGMIGEEGLESGEDVDVPATSAPITMDSSSYAGFDRDFSLDSGVGFDAYSPELYSEFSGAASPAELEEMMLRKAIAMSLGQTEGDP